MTVIHLKFMQCPTQFTVSIVLRIRPAIGTAFSGLISVIQTVKVLHRDCYRASRWRYLSMRRAVIAIWATDPVMCTQRVRTEDCRYIYGCSSTSWSYCLFNSHCQELRAVVSVLIMFFGPIITLWRAPRKANYIRRYGSLMTRRSPISWYWIGSRHEAYTTSSTFFLLSSVTSYKFYLEPCAST